MSKPKFRRNDVTYGVGNDKTTWHALGWWALMIVVVLGLHWIF